MMDIGSGTTAALAASGFAREARGVVPVASKTEAPSDNKNTLLAGGNEPAALAKRAKAEATSNDKKMLEGLSEQELAQVRELAARDREVRAHEQAHASVGGQYASAPSYTFQRGPDGRQYAVGGQVSIDVSPIPGDPEATLAKARIVRRAALAPAQPSAQDRAVAAEATAIEQQARIEISANKQAIAAQRYASVDRDLASFLGGDDLNPSGSAKKSNNQETGTVSFFI